MRILVRFLLRFRVRFLVRFLLRGPERFPVRFPVGFRIDFPPLSAFCPTYLYSRPRTYPATHSLTLLVTKHT